MTFGTSKGWAEGYFDKIGWLAGGDPCFCSSIGHSSFCSPMHVINTLSHLHELCSFCATVLFWRSVLSQCSQSCFDTVSCSVLSVTQSSFVRVFFVFVAVSFLDPAVVLHMLLMLLLRLAVPGRLPTLAGGGEGAIPSRVLLCLLGLLFRFSTTPQPLAHFTTPPYRTTVGFKLTTVGLNRTNCWVQRGNCWVQPGNCWVQPGN